MKPVRAAGQGQLYVIIDNQRDLVTFCQFPEFQCLGQHPVIISLSQALFPELDHGGASFQGFLHLRRQTPALCPRPVRHRID